MDGTRVHTHSAAMCWAGCQRLAAIANHLNLPERATHWSGIAERIGEEVLKRAWSPKRKAFSAAFDSEDLDASALLLAELGLVSPDDPRFIATVEAIGLELRRGFHVMRYVAADDFGLPELAFLICRFWLVDALWEIGRQDEAHDMFVDALRMRNRYGLLSEDVHPVTGKLWGNFPQTDSMSGLILDGNQAVAKLGRPVLARLVVVSNRVAVPDRATRAGGLEVAIRPALKRHGGLWFGWSGRVAENTPRAVKSVTHDNITYATVDLSKDDYQEFYNGFANRVLWPILHYRLDLAEFTRRDLGGYFRVNQYFATQLESLLQPDDVIWRP